MKLDSVVKAAILRYLKDGINSARAISFQLIDDGLIVNERFSTGKPWIYPWVCIYLEGLCKEGKAVRMWSMNARDRAYRLCTEESLPSVVSDIQDAG